MYNLSIMKKYSTFFSHTHFSFRSSLLVTLLTLLLRFSFNLSFGQCNNVADVSSAIVTAGDRRVSCSYVSIASMTYNTNCDRLSLICRPLSDDTDPW